MRLLHVNWSQITDETLEDYRKIRNTIRNSVSNSKAESSLAYLYHFATRFNKNSNPQLSNIQQAIDRNSLSKAQEVWSKMSANWSAKHRCHVRVSICRAMTLLNPQIACIINPNMERSKGHSRHQWVCERSAVSRVAKLEDVLPLRIRQAPDRVEYRLLSHIGRHLIPKMSSVSVSHCRQMLGFIYHLLFDKEPLLRIEMLQQGTRECLAHLAKLSATDWMDRLESMFDQNSRKISLAYFRLQVRYVSMLYSNLGPTRRARFPLPCRHRSTSHCSVDDYISSASSSMRSGDDAAYQEREELQTRMQCLRQKMCTAWEADAESSVTAFSSDQVKLLIAASISAIERVVVITFLITGLRIGGISRLSFGQIIDGPVVPNRIPMKLFTTEKNGKKRTVYVNDALRILISRYINQQKHYKSYFLFPGDRDGHVSTKTIYRVCASIFDRCGIHASGFRAHPHAFRHTVVQMLYLGGGLSFETISKWIGHSSQAITSGIYGKISADTLNDAIYGVLSGDPKKDDAVKEQWRSVFKLIQKPYPFEDSEISSLRA